MRSLTAKQQEVIDYIRTFTEAMGFQPSIREIAIGLKINPPAVEQRMYGLLRKGIIRREPGRARAIEFVKEEL